MVVLSYMLAIQQDSRGTQPASNPVSTVWASLQRKPCFKKSSHYILIKQFYYILQQMRKQSQHNCRGCVTLKPFLSIHGPTKAFALLSVLKTTHCSATQFITSYFIMCQGSALALQHKYKHNLACSQMKLARFIWES